VVNAPSERREGLLKELENFAFRGIPNVSSPRIVANQDDSEDGDNALLVPEEDDRRRFGERSKRRQSTSTSDVENNGDSGNRYKVR
jgi:hypothetical protein